MPRQPIVASAGRRPLAAVACAAALLVLALGIALHDARTTSFDTWAFHQLSAHLGWTAAHRLIDFSLPAISITGLAIIAVGSAVRRDWMFAVFAVVGPLVALGMTEVILKPLVHRVWLPSVSPFGTQAVGEAFPSGHETGLTSLLLVLALLAARLPLRATVRVLVYVVLAAWCVLGAVGLVRNYFHYATDTIGGVGVAVACLLGIGFGLDAVDAALARRRVSAPDARSPARTSRAA